MKDFMYVYMDNAATTKPYREAVEAALPFMNECYGNPSSLHTWGRAARKAIDKAREQVAKAIGAVPDDIIFTSGGTEANNLAIYGYGELGDVICSEVEHPSVYKNRYIFHRIPVDRNGKVYSEEVENAIANSRGTDGKYKDKPLISVMAANNEIGTLNDVESIANVCRRYGAVYHTDATQAVGHQRFQVYKQNISMLTMSAHKFHGLKGAGALFVNRSPNFEFGAAMNGGEQENGYRPGTENVPAIVAMGKAIEMVYERMDESEKIIKQRWNQILDELITIGGVWLNGSGVDRNFSNINVGFEDVEGEALLIDLAMNGIAVSTGSACNSESKMPSHVLKAIGLTDKAANSCIRLSIDETLTDEQVEYAVYNIKKSVQEMRDQKATLAGVRR